MPRHALSSTGCALALILLAPGAQAAEHFIDPAAGSPAGDGSAQKPWQTLEQVAKAGAFGAAIQAGDTVWLRSGYHGAPSLQGSFDPPVTIAPLPGAKPLLAGLAFKGARGFSVSGLSVSPSHAPTPAVGTMLTFDASSAQVVVEDCDLFSVEDASGWDADAWINAASSGISIKGASITVRRNRLRNVRFGISVEGAGALVDHNQIADFSADGIRGLGDDGVYQYNLVKNVHVDDAAGDSNHDDGFQSWSVGPGGVGTGVVKNVTLRGNVFINREDPNQKLPNSMQGIGCFDGFFEGWVVENNVVITDHWHGISFYGMRSSRIVNNTVIDVNDVKPGPPWIMVTAHKDGTPSHDVLVRNNLATDFQIEGDSITDDHNTTLTDLSAFFVSPATFDLHLLPGAPAVDSGSADMAPPTDIEGIARPQGAGVDQGAYEWHDPSVGPVDAGLGGSGGGGSMGVGGSVGVGGTVGVGGSGGEGGGAPGAKGGCGCALPAGSPGSAGAAILGLAMLALRRRTRVTMRRCNSAPRSS